MSRDEDNSVRDEVVDRVLSRLADAFPADQNRPGDDALVERNLDALLERRAGKRPSARASQFPKRWPLLAAATIGACACLWVGVKSIGRGGGPANDVPRGVSSIGTPAPATTSVSEAPAPAESSVPTLDVSSLPTAQSATGSPAPLPAPPPASSVRPAPTSSRTAAELFSAANDARRRRNVNEARSLYRELESAYPQSAEAMTSLVALGRLELDSGNTRAALEQFDAYLRSGRHELHEDALIGRASALESLGRREEERRAWQTLLGEYPNTLFAAHAKARSATP